MSNFDVAEFKAKVGGGPLRNNKFSVELGQLPPGMFGTSVAQTLKTLKFYAEAVDLPGSHLMTNGVHRRYGYGPVEKKPYSPLFGECRIVLRTDQDGNVFRFMREWQSVSVGFTTEGLVADEDERGRTPYEVGYKTDYAVMVTITTYGDDGRVAESIRLLDAWPMSVGDAPLAWSMNNSYAQLPVTLAFSQQTFRPPTRQ